jgi:hypothetical protein
MKKTLPNVYQGQCIDKMTAQEARQALKIVLLQAREQRVSFLSVFATLQNSQTSQDVQSLDNITHEKTDKDSVNFALYNPRADSIYGPGDSRTNVAGIISEYLEDE